MNLLNTNHSKFSPTNLNFEIKGTENILDFFSYKHSKYIKISFHFRG